MLRDLRNVFRGVHSQHSEYTYKRLLCQNTTFGNAISNSTTTLFLLFELFTVSDLNLHISTDAFRPEGCCSRATQSATSSIFEVYPGYSSPVCFETLEHRYGETTVAGCRVGTNRFIPGFHRIITTA